MRAVTTLALVLLLSGPALAAGSAPGKDSSPEARAEGNAAFQRAVTAYREARYPTAIEEFLEAYRRLGDAAIVYNIGQAWEKQGDLGKALGSYREYLRLTPGANDRVTVEAMIRNLEERLQRQGVQQLTVRTVPDGAEVSIDGAVRALSPFTGELPPGTHRISVRLGERTAERTVELLAARALEVTVELPAAATAAAPPSATAAAPAPARELSVATWASLGGAGALLAGSLVFEVLRQGAEEEAKGAKVQTDYGEKWELMESRAAVARILLGLGAAAGVAGGVSLYLDLDGDAGAGGDTAVLAVGGRLP